MASLKKTGETPSEVKLMQGSSTGATYFPFARKGNVLLGIKPEGAANGHKWGLSDCTYFAARLRSAPEAGLFADEDAQKKVVKLIHNPENLWDAWPSVVWEKKDASRASTTIGVFVKGQFNGDKRALDALIGEISHAKLSIKMAKYLFEIAGKENAICTVEELSTRLEDQFHPFFDRIMEHVAAANAITSELRAHVGHFNMQAALLKKVYDATHPKKAPDAAEAEDDFRGRPALSHVHARQAQQPDRVAGRDLDRPNQAHRGGRRAVRSHQRLSRLSQRHVAALLQPAVGEDHAHERRARVEHLLRSRSWRGFGARQG